MLILIKRFLHDYSKVYLYFYIIDLFFKVLTVLFSNHAFIEVLRSVWILVSSTMLITISTYYIYNFLYTRNRFYYYTLKYSKLYTATLLSIIMSIFNLIHYFIYGEYDWLMVIQKIISIFSYFALVLIIFYFFRSTFSKKTGLNLSLLTILSIILLQGLYIYQVFGKALENNFMIGISSHILSKNVYINILPITLMTNSEMYHEIAIYTFIVNVAILLLITILNIFTRKQKINW